MSNEQPSSAADAGAAQDSVATPDAAADGERRELLARAARWLALMPAVAVLVESDPSRAASYED